MNLKCFFLGHKWSSNMTPMLIDYEPSTKCFQFSKRHLCLRCIKIKLKTVSIPEEHPSMVAYRTIATV